MEGGASWASCSASEAGPDEAPLAIWVADSEGEQHWHRGVYATAWGCPPDLLAQVYLLANMGEDGVMPQACDHAACAHVCSPLRNPETDDLSGAPLRRASSDILGWIRSEGEAVSAWPGRQHHVDEIGVGIGAGISWFFTSNLGLGLVGASRVVEDTHGDGGSGPGR